VMDGCTHSEGSKVMGGGVMSEVSGEVSAGVSDLRTFLRYLFPRRKEASRKSKERSRSERTLAKLLKVIEEHDGTTMTSRS
jgi:hypothetical protein